MPAKKPDPFKEEFAKFFEAPSRETLRNVLKNHLGETDYCDFKGTWPELTKVAKHILGLANSGGGMVIFGVEEKDDKTLEAVGLVEIVDKTKVHNGIQKYLPDHLLGSVGILDFTFEASEYPAIVGKRFQVVSVPDSPEHLPYVSTGSGDGIRGTAIYIRRGTSTEEANHEELQRIVNRRLETGYSSKPEIDLMTHIEQLKVLYNQVSRNTYVVTGGAVFGTMRFMQQMYDSLEQKTSKPNPNYPGEDFEAFIVRVIAAKKLRIEKELDIIP